MINGPQVFHSPDGDGGDGGSDGADAVAAAETWHGDYTYFQENPDALKAFEKYESPDEAFKGAHEAIKRFGKPYHLPDDPSKLSDEQHAEIEQWRARARGVPETPGAYEIDVPENFQVFDELLDEFKQFCHRTGKTPAEAKELFGLHVKTFEFANRHRDRVIQGMADANYKKFKDVDCNGDAKLAATRMELTKQYLQMFCVDDDENPDNEQWEKLVVQLYHHDRMIQLPLMRALYAAAQMKLGTGGGPGGGPISQSAPDGIQYPEMRKSQRR